MNSIGHRLTRLLLVLFALLASIGIASGEVSAFTYDGAGNFQEATADGPSWSLGEGPSRQDVGETEHVHTPGVGLRLVAEPNAPQTSRGLSPLGGVIEQTGTNAAGGRIYSSTGAINQNDFAGIVNSGLTRGDDVHIFTGAHGLADGRILTDASLLADDVARFGDIPGVHIHDLPSMSPAQVREILDGPGTIVGGFCESGACLAGFGG